MSQEDKEEQIRRVKTFMKKRYPHANVDSLVIKYSRKKPMVLVVSGPQGGETPIVLADGSDIQKSFLKKTFVKKALGPPAGDLIQKISEDIRKRQKELKKLRASEQLLRSKDEEAQTLNEKMKREQAKIDQLKDDQETDNKAEIKRKEELIKSLKKDSKTKQKERGDLQTKTGNHRPT